MHRVWTLAMKDLKLLVRDRAALFWVFVWPLIFGIFFGTLMGGSGERTSHGLVVAVIDEDRTPESKEFVAALRKSDALAVRDTLTLERARDRVRRGVLAAYVRILPGFAKASGFRPVEGTAIELGIDPARKAERGMLEGLVTQASFTGIQKMFTEPDRMRASLRESRAAVDSSGMQPKDRRNIENFLGSLEVYLKNVDSSGTGGGSGPPKLSGPKVATVAVTPDLRQPRSAFEISFPSAILWALLGCTMGFAQSLVSERTMGTYGRLRSTPLTRAEFLLGKGLASYLTGFTVILALLAIGRGLLGVRLENPVALVAALFTIPLCFTGLMLLFANLGKSERAVSGAGWAVMLVFSMLGGGMIPLIAMPPWMQTASGVSPVKWGIVALEGSVWRGYSPAEMALPCAILASVGLVGFSIGWVLSKRLES